MMPPPSVRTPRRPAKSAPRLTNLWKTGCPAAVLALALAALLCCEMPLAGFRGDVCDSILVVGAQAAGVVENRAVPAAGASLPHGILETPFFPGGLVAASVPTGFSLRFPAPGKTNPPTDGEYAFTRTRIRTLSALCRIACG